jgi:cysteine desulfurase
MKQRIYLDNHSTTRVDPRVVDAMLPYFSECFGNAASGNHCFGWEAKEAVDLARQQVATMIGAKPEEIVFTSGATESDNLALKGTAMALRDKGNHIITSKVEHKAILNTCGVLEQQGFRTTYLPVDKDGLVNCDDLKKAITPQTVLVSIMHANNEIGVVQNLTEVGRLCKEHEIIFHSDTAQSAAKIAIDVDALGLDLASFSAHKFYGPKGVGALYVRGGNPRTKLEPIINGGGQENGMRSGTLNVPAIVGLGKACAIATSEKEGESARVLNLRERLRTGIINQLDDVHLNGHLEKRLPGNLNLSFGGAAGYSLLKGLENEIAVSSGSACSSASSSNSYVLKAIGCPDELIDSSLRFGIGRFNTEDEIDHAVGRIVELVTELRR